MRYIKLLFIGLVYMALTGCTDRLEEWNTNPASEGNGEVRISLAAVEMPVVQTRTAGQPEIIESVVLFVFKQGETKVFKKMMQYFDDESADISLFLPHGTYSYYAVCNWSDPELLYAQVGSLQKLQEEKLVLLQPDDAYMGKYVMFGTATDKVMDANTLQVDIPVYRLASFHDFTITFEPLNTGDSFQLTKAWLQNIPRGCWLMERKPVKDPTVESYNESVKGCEEDWAYQSSDHNMQQRFFTDLSLKLEQLSLTTDEQQHGMQWKVNGQQALLENRRGALPVKRINEEDCNDKYWEGSEALANASDSESRVRLKALRQYAKHYHAKNEMYEGSADRPKFKFSTCLVLKGIYQSNGGTSEATYYIHLGEDGYRDFNIRRNYLYKTNIRVLSLNEVDSRVERISLKEASLTMPDEEVLDAHCNVVKTVFFSDAPWEIWVEDPDKTPWLELSGSEQYYNKHVGGGPEQADQEKYPCYKMSGNMPTLRNIYIHVDEYIPNLDNPLMNNRTQVRSGRIAYRKKGNALVKYITVKQYPAQLAVLEIKSITGKVQARDTFYIERKLEKKYMTWGLESYWSFITDALIAGGKRDGLSNTRQLYHVALFGDKWGVKPAYPYPQYDGIPRNTALGYIVNKNRDRDGNGKVDQNEILWYFPALKEMQCLYKAVNSGLVTFDGSNSIFHTSSPSSADMGGVTTGFSYYVKMTNGKYGIGQRTRLYNVLALRRKNVKQPVPDAGDASFTMDVITDWENEEVIMPKPE